MAAAVEKAYSTIRDGIISGVYGPGAHLTTEKLAAVSGLSRTPVREAMRRLHAEGLVRFIPNRGAFVTNLEERDINKIYGLRVVLEGYAAESAAQEASEDQIAELADLADEMARLVKTPSPAVIEEIARNNSEFHRLIVRAAANPRLETALAAIVETPLVMRTFRRYSPRETRRSATHHALLVEAIRARDGAWARNVMTSHILAGKNALLRSVSERGEPL